MVESVQDLGSRFSFKLEFPLAQPEDVLTNEALRQTLLAIPKFENQYILLVDDNRTNQQVARELLETVKLNVTVANNGEEALKAVADAVAKAPTEASFDLILMDIQLPDMSGFDVMTRLRQEQKGQNIPAISANYEP